MSYRTLMILFLLATPVLAQTNEETYQNIQFNFFPPGAAAAAMGGAFIGWADDATAAATNPAGLTKLSRPQVYGEFKRLGIDTKRFELPNGLESRRTSEFSQGVNSLSFFSLATPLGDRLAISFSRHEFLSYNEKFTIGTRVVPLKVDGRLVSSLGFPGLRGTTDVEGASYAGSIAAVVNRRLKVGMTVSAQTLDIDTSLLYDFPPSAGGPKSTFVDDFDVRAGVTAGALIEAITDKLSLGVTYSRNPNFHFQQKYTFTDPNQTLEETELSMNIPDRAGVGVAVRPTDRLLILADTVHVRYSDLSRSLTVILDRGVVSSADFRVDDGTEFHLGGEIQAKPWLFFRGGMFTNPSHTLQFVGDYRLNIPGPLPPEQARFLAALEDTLTSTFRGVQYGSPYDETEYGFSLGGGIGGEKLRVDLAFVKQESLSQIVGSFDFRF